MNFYCKSDIEMVAMSKNVSNVHRQLQIAFAEDLYLYCKANSLSFTELREAINTKWNVDIPEPRDGIGANFVSEEPGKYLQPTEYLNSKIISAAMKVDNEYIKLKRVGVEALCKDVSR
jgi:UDP-N-acetyl-D-mannosaminuronate dehydrogenase